MNTNQVIQQVNQHLTQAQKSLMEAHHLLGQLDRPTTVQIKNKYPRFKMFVRKDKGEAFEKALQSFGYESVNDWRIAQFVLADHDQRGDIRIMQRDNKKFFIHPHSARSMILWDGILPTTSFVQCNFVFAPGQKEVMQAYGYRRPVEVVGWTYCPIQPFMPAQKIENVLFAAIHPNMGQDRQGRRLMQIDQDLNKRSLDVLRGLNLNVTVRYSGRLEDNGLPQYPDTIYQEADLTMGSSLRAMQGFDVVVAHQTFAYLAVASGIPTVMFGEDTPPHSMHMTVKSWDKYKHILMFPLDLLQGDPQEVLERAAQDDSSIREWKSNFIGEPFSAEGFVSALEKYLV